MNFIKRIQDKVVSNKTVDAEFEAKKQEFLNFKKEFNVLEKKILTFNKEFSTSAKAFSKIVETTRNIYTNPCETSIVFEDLTRVAGEANQEYESNWNNKLQEMLKKYDGIIKHLAKRIQDRDNARIDYDRAKAKWEKNQQDQQAESQMRLNEQTYYDTHENVSDNINFFLERKNANINAIISVFSQATVQLYSSCANFRTFGVLQLTEEFVPSAVPKRSPRQEPPRADANPNLALSGGLPPVSRANKPPLGGPGGPPMSNQPYGNQPQGYNNNYGNNYPAAGGNYGGGDGSSTPAVNRAPYAQGGGYGDASQGQYGSNNHSQSLPAVNRNTRPPSPRQSERKVEMLYDFTPAQGDAEGLAASEGQILTIKVDHSGLRYSLTYLSIIFDDDHS